MSEKKNLIRYVKISNSNITKHCVCVCMLCLVLPALGEERMLRPPEANRSDGGKSRDGFYQRFTAESVTQELGVDYDYLLGISGVAFVPLIYYPATQNSHKSGFPFPPTSGFDSTANN